MKRRWLRLSVVVVIAVMVAACSGLGADPDRQQITLRIWNPQDNWRDSMDLYPKRVAEFERQHPNVTVEYVDVPYGQYEARYMAGFASQSDAPDIFMGQVSFYAGGMGVAAEVPEDLQAEWTANLAPLTQPNFKVDGRWYGYPVSTDLGMQLFYNVDQFEEAGLDAADPPETFDELRTYADKLAVRKNGKVTRNGMALRYSGSASGIADKALPFMHAFGGRLFAEDQQTASGVLDSEDTVAGVQFMQDLVIKDKVTSLELGSPDDTFAQGLSSMTFREGWYEGWLQENAPDINFEVAPYPSGPDGYPRVSLLFNWAWMVYNEGPHQDIAWDWIRAVANPDLDLELAKLEGYLPVWQRNFDTPFVRDRKDWTAVQRQLEEGAGPVYNAPYNNQIGIVIGEAVEAALQGHDVQESLRDVIPEVDALLVRGQRVDARQGGE